jgi:uncharacterized protein DUF3887
MRRLGKFFLPLLAMLVIEGLALAQTPGAQPGQKPDAKSAEKPVDTPDGKSGQELDGKAGPEADGKSGKEVDGKASENPDETHLAITKDVMNEFAQGALAAVRGRFDADLQNAVSESDMQDAHDQLFEVAGVFQSQISQTAHLSQGATVYVSRSQCAHFQVELRLTFDVQNRITDFRIGPVSSLGPESMEAAARDLADLLEKGQFADANAKFNARLKGNMPADRLEASWTHVMMHLGPFKSIQSAKKDPDLDRVDVRCEFEHGPMIVRVAFDPAGKVSGLWMLPAETEKDSQI